MKYTCVPGEFRCKNPLYTLKRIFSAVCAGGVFLWRNDARGALLISVAALIIIPWAIWESGLDFWALFPRLSMPLGLAACALALGQIGSEPENSTKPKSRISGFLPALTFGGLTIGIFALAFFPHGVISPGKDTEFKLASGVENTLRIGCHMGGPTLVRAALHLI